MKMSIQIRKTLNKNLSIANSYKEDNYDYIQYEFEKLINVFRQVKKNLTFEKKFLEVGSGPGLNLLLAEEFLNVNPTGLEYNPELVKLSRTLHRFEIIEMDAMDFNNYDQYDIIYMWLPFKNEELEFKLEEKIFNQAKEGTFLIFIDSKNLDKFENVEKISEFIIKKNIKKYI